MKVLAILCLLIFSCIALATDFQPPHDLGPTNEYGRHLQRSLRLMKHSAPDKKRTVRVLFYGQSIMQQAWTLWVTDFLRQQYPNANLIVTNLALGYSSEILCQPAQVDISNFYPDLMIFHDFGPEAQYEQIIDIARRRTTADILIQNDHVYRAEDMNEVTDPANANAMSYAAHHNYVALPAIAQRYGAEFGDIRTYWRKYLQDYNLVPNDLLVDGLHPNWPGNYLFQDLVQSYLREDDLFAADEWINAEKNYIMGRDVNWTNNVLNLDFVGNRVDVICSDSGNSPIQVRIDGGPASGSPELYSFTRPDWYPGTAWLTVLNSHPRSPLLAEDWTGKVLEFQTNGPFMRFSVTGSRTGYDGEGDNTHPFVSNSGRVLIDPADWLMLYWTSAYYPAIKPLQPGFEFHWRSQFNGRDEFTPSVADPGLESTVTIAQGLGNGPHTLQLIRSGPSPVSAIRIFNPLARPQPEHLPVQLEVKPIDSHTLRVQVDADGRYVIESSNDCTHWLPITSPIAETDYTLNVEPGPHFLRARWAD